MKRIYLVCAGIAAMLFFGIHNMPYAFLGTSGITLVATAWGYRPRIQISRIVDIKRITDVRAFVQKIHRPKIKSISEGPAILNVKPPKVKGFLKAEQISPDSVMTLASVFLRLSIAKKIERKMINVVKTAIVQSGSMEDSRRLVHYSISLAFLSLVPSVVGSIAASILVSPVFLPIMLIPVAFLMSGTIHLRVIKSQRKNAIEHELPVFIMCTSIMEQVGFSMYVFLEKLSRTKTSLFPTIQRDAKLFIRNTTFLAMPHEQALKRIAASHPNEKFKDLVNDYTSARTTSGASTANTMMSATESAFRSMRYKIKAYADNAQSIAQMLLLLMTIAPIMGIAGSILASGTAAFQMTLMITVMMPVMCIMVILMIDGKQPRTHNETDVAREAVVAGAITGIVMVVLGRPVWEVLGVSIAIFAGINTTRNISYFRSLSQLDKAIPKFLQEVTDGMTDGMTVYESIKRKRDTSNVSLKRILGTLYKKMYMGTGLVDATESIKSQSWLSHVVFFVLGYVNESGAASAGILQSFTNFTKDYEESKHEMLTSLKSSVAMGYIIPVLMTFMLIISAQLLDSITGSVGDVGNLPIAIPDVQDADALTESSFVLVVLCSALIGFVVSKIAYFTVKYTLHVCILSSLAVVLCHMVPFVPPFF